MIVPPAGNANSPRIQKTKRIALFGVFGHGNIGNDASLQAMLEFLRRARPNAELVCVCLGPERVLADYHIPAISINWPRSANRVFRILNILLLKVPARLVDLFYTFRAAQNFDVLMIPGTGILDDWGDRPWNMPYALLKWCLAARIWSVKIAFVSIGAGPMNHPVNRWLLKSAARLAHYRSYRDTGSKNFMECIGIDTRADSVFPDLVFGLETPFLATTRMNNSPINVGIGVMMYYGPSGYADGDTQIYETYVMKITQFVRWLLAQGHSVRLLVGDAFDHPVVDVIIKTVKAENASISHQTLLAERVKNYDELMSQIALTDLVVATRFHNLICALKLNRPAISLGYRPRHEELMAEMGLGAFCQRIEDLDVDRLIDQFTTLALARTNFAGVVRDANVVCRKRLVQQEDFLTARLL